MSQEAKFSHVSCSRCGSYTIAVDPECVHSDYCTTCGNIPVEVSVIVPLVHVGREASLRIRQNVLSSPVKTEAIVAGEFGVGLARDLGVWRSCGSLVVMFDSDVVIHPGIWSFLLGLKAGEFAMAVNCGNVSCRVFAVRRRDYDLVGGFDPDLKYCCEDIDFYLKALDLGLTCRFVPSNLFRHVDHAHRTLYRWLLVRLSWEYSRMLVKHRRRVFRNMFEFYLRPFDWKLLPWSLVTRVVGTFYWMIRDKGVKFGDAVEIVLSKLEGTYKDPCKWRLIK